MPSEALTGTRIEPVFPLTINLRHAAYTMGFPDLTTLQHWIDVEVSGWRTFEGQLPTVTRKIFKKQTIDLDPLSVAANRLAVVISSEETGPEADLARAVTAFNNTRYIPMQSELGDMIRDMNGQQNGLGAVILAGIRGDDFELYADTRQNTVNLRPAFEAVANVQLMLGHYQRLVEISMNKAEKRITEFQTRLDQGIGRIDTELKQQADDLIAKLGEADDLKGTITDKLASATKELETLEQRYKVEKEYGKAISYWAEKREDHRRAILGTFYMLATLFIAPLMVLGIGYNSILTTIERLAGINEKAWIPLAAVLSLAGFCYVGFVRLIGRINRENSAEYDDAHLRETLINTYLALRLDPTHPLNDGERLLALHAMFRGSARAPTADDTPPVNTLEALINTLKPGGGKT